MSASSWGCELKYIQTTRKKSNNSQPLREAVSWNFCAAVQCRGYWPSASSWGCELKLTLTLCSAVTCSSASSWGCELKCSVFAADVCCPGQPLREAVSWNMIERFVSMSACCQPLREAVSWNDHVRQGWSELCSVSLFVRLWVEMIPEFAINPIATSASSWGCELKYKGLWVFSVVVLSASSWGCELKCQFSTNPHAVPGVSLFVRLWVEMWLSGSAVCWPSSASSWGCELKCAKFLYGFNGIIVSLFVRLWVEISSINCFYSIIWTSASSWGCELK